MMLSHAPSRHLPARREGRGLTPRPSHRSVRCSTATLCIHDALVQPDNGTAHADFPGVAARSYGTRCMRSLCCPAGRICSSVTITMPRPGRVWMGNHSRSPSGRKHPRRRRHRKGRIHCLALGTRPYLQPARADARRPTRSSGKILRVSNAKYSVIRWNPADINSHYRASTVMLLSSPRSFSSAVTRARLRRLAMA